jgi:muconate cycloisomerase
MGSSHAVLKPAFIEEAELYKCRCGVDLHFSYGHIREIHFLICVLKSGPVAGFGETLSDNFDALRKGAADLVGKDACSLDGILPDSVNDAPGVRECLSMAVYDLAARRIGAPLHFLLGGKKRQSVPLMPMLFAATPEEAAEKVRTYREQGFTAIRLKIFGDVDDDTALLESVRTAAGDETTLVADANQGYKELDRAIDACREFDRLGIDIVEDPLKGDVRDYAKLRKKMKAQLMVSALSGFPFAELREVIEEGAADIVNHNPCQLSSLSEALRVNNMVEGFGFKSHVGGIGFFGVGTAVYQQLASVIGLGLPCGEVGGWVDHGYPGSLVQEPYRIVDGAVKIPDLPGTGIEIAPDKLNEFIETSEVIK